MDIPIFENELKTIDPHIRIVPHPLNTDVCGIYWNNAYIGAIPNGQIYDEKKEGYKDNAGYTHKTRPEAIAQVKSFLWRLQNEHDFLETMTEDL